MMKQHTIHTRKVFKCLPSEKFNFHTGSTDWVKEHKDCIECHKIFFPLECFLGRTKKKTHETLF